MIPEATEMQDRFVKCIFCAQPIPLSPRLANLHIVANDGAQRAEQERRSGVVLLRCTKCSREAQYRRDDIISRSATETAKIQPHLNAFRKAAS